MKIYMFRTVPLSIIRSFFTVLSAMVHVIQFCIQLSSRARILVLLESCLQTCMTYAIAECTVNKLLTMGRGNVRHMQSFITKSICGISASSWFYCKEMCALIFYTTFVYNISHSKKNSARHYHKYT